MQLASSKRGFCAMPVDGPRALPPCLDLDASAELLTTVSSDKTIMFLKVGSMLEEDKPVRHWPVSLLSLRRSATQHPSTLRDSAPVNVT